MAIDVLDWANLQDVSCVMDNQLNMMYFNGKPLRGIYGCLLVRGKVSLALFHKLYEPLKHPYFNLMT
jgi:hypothetical protein